MKLLIFLSALANAQVSLLTGSLNNVTFSNLDVRGVYRPLVLDQFYCPERQHPGVCANETDAVAGSDVTVSGIVGWQTSGVAAMLHCSQSKPCGVVATGIDVRSVPGCSNVVRCLNVASRPGAACAGRRRRGCPQQRCAE